MGTAMVVSIIRMEKATISSTRVRPAWLLRRRSKPEQSLPRNIYRSLHLKGITSAPADCWPEREQAPLWAVVAGSQAAWSRWGPALRAPFAVGDSAQGRAAGHLAWVSYLCPAPPGGAPDWRRACAARA